MCPTARRVRGSMTGPPPLRRDRRRVGALDHRACAPTALEPCPGRLRNGAPRQARVGREGARVCRGVVERTWLGLGLGLGLRLELGLANPNPDPSQVERTVARRTPRRAASADELRLLHRRTAPRTARQPSHSHWLRRRRRRTRGALSARARRAPGRVARRRRAACRHGQVCRGRARRSGWHCAQAAHTGGRHRRARHLLGGARDLVSHPIS